MECSANAGKYDHAKRLKLRHCGRLHDCDIREHHVLVGIMGGRNVCAMSAKRTAFESWAEFLYGIIAS